MIILIIAEPYMSIGVRSQMNKDILADLQGDIYYAKRDEGILKLYKSGANLEDEKLIYSHKDKGYLDENFNNDNIIDFHYNQKEGNINLVAMNDGEWSLYSIEEGEDNAKLIGLTRDNLKNDISLDTVDYISTEHDNLIAFPEKGSIYIEKDGEKELVKKFNGIHDWIWTGYEPIGFSPDEKYLIYSSMEHLTPMGSFVHHLISQFGSNVYIMDLSTGKSARFVESYDIQWVN